MGPMPSNLTRCLIFAQKPVNINVSKSAAPKQALVPANRYECDMNRSYDIVCAKYIRLERGSDGGP